MSGVTKVNTSYKKTNYPKQKLGGVGFQHTEFYHQATDGQLVIDFNSLVLSSGAASEGFSNPSPAALVAANLKANRGNLTLKSYRGEWVDREDYTIQDNSKITLKKPAEDGEVFYGKIHNIVRNTTENPDFQNITASGILAQGQTIFNVGKFFKVNANPLYQIGEIQVFRGNSPVIMLRNVGNAAANISADGNYTEIDSNGGYGNTIQFNEAGAVGGELIVVISTGRLLERPSTSILQEVETLSGQISNVIPYVEDLMGFAPGTLLAAPNNVDLKSFGDMLLALNTKYNSELSLTEYVDSKSKVKAQTKFLATTVTGTTATNAGLSFNSLIVGKWYRLTGVAAVDAPTVSANALLSYQTGATLVGQVGHSASGGVSPGRSWLSFDFLFQAEATSLPATVTCNPSGSMFGNGTKSQTFVTLEELPNHEITTAWT